MEIAFELGDSRLESDDLLPKFEVLSLKIEVEIPQLTVLVLELVKLFLDPVQALLDLRDLLLTGFGKPLIGVRSILMSTESCLPTRDPEGDHARENRAEQSNNLPE
jgi:hypothetical protein